MKPFPKPPILTTAVDFGASAVAGIAAALVFAEGDAVFGCCWAVIALIWFAAGCVGLYSLKLLVKAAECRGEVQAYSRMKAISEEWSR